MRLFAVVIGVVGIQPERLNAEGDSPAKSHSLRSGIRPFRSRCGFVLPRIFTDLGRFTQYCANLCHVCANLCFLYEIGWFWRWIFTVQKKDAIVHLARLHLLIFYPVWGELFYCANAFGI